jgi:hypothetical protein
MSIPAAARRTTRVRGLTEWQPQHATRQLLETVRAVLAEYRIYLPMTLPQVFYRLVGAHGYDKTEGAYGRLGEALNRARRAGTIPFEAIRDDDADIVTRRGWGGPLELIEQWQEDTRSFRLDRQEGQPHRLLIMVEARGRQPQIQGAAEDYSVPVIASGGFDSLTAKYALARAIGSRHGLTEVLHIGDHDPSGTHLFASLADDVATLIRDLWLPGRVLFERLAVTPAQMVDFSLPTAPPKRTDRRSFAGETVQAEAFPPDVIVQITTDAITDRLDVAAYRQVLDREGRIRDRLVETLEPLLDEDWEAQP